MSNLLPEQSLGVWRLFFRNICGEFGLVMGNLYSMFTFEPMHNLHLGVLKRLKNCLNQYFLCKVAYTHPAGPSRKQKRLDLLSAFLLRAYTSILALIKKEYALLGLHVNFARRKRTSQLYAMFTGDELRGRLERKNYYAVEILSPSTAAIIGRSLGFGEPSKLTRMNVPYRKTL